MKVCFFTNEFPPNIYGGAGVHVDYLSRELAKISELSVKYFGSESYAKNNINVMAALIDNSLFKNVPPELKNVFSAFYKCLNFFNIDFTPDVVHCHTWYSHFAGIIAKLAYGIPLVITTHSLEPLRPWKREQIGRGFDVSSWLEYQALTMADAIIAVSIATKNDILKLFPVKGEKIHVIPNGIDTDEYKPTTNNDVLKKYGINPEKPYVLFVGRITKQKGIIHLVDAIPHINKNCQVVLCAGAPDTPQIQAEMDEHINKVKKTCGNVIWISKMLDNEEKIQLYSHARVFCCPSIYEPFGIINLEAISCGIPVVGSKTGGIPEIITDNETGFLVPIKVTADENCDLINPEKFSKELAKNINKVVTSDDVYHSLSKNCRKTAIEKFSWKKIAGEVYTIYQLVSDKKIQ